MAISMSEDEIKSLVFLPKDFSLKFIDFEYGFSSKIYPYISESILGDLKTSHPDIFKLVYKAGLHYSFVLSIPRIKVHIGNYGITKFEQNKASNAPWWDVRDLGISWLKKADECLSEALSLIKNHDSLKSKTSFFQDSFLLLDFWDVKQFYNINNSIEVYANLSSLMKNFLDDLLTDFGDCVIDDLIANNYLKSLVKKYVINRAFAEATQRPPFLFINKGLVIQYEELPWQKSVVLDSKMLVNNRILYQSKADLYLRKIWDYIERNKSNFPCYVSKIDDDSSVKIISKKSGLFL